MATEGDSLRTETFLDTARHRLEDGWLHGDGLPVEELLAGVPPALAKLFLPELLGMEIRLRRVVGQEPHAEDFQRRFPGAGSAISEAFRIAAEFQGELAEPQADAAAGRVPKADQTTEEPSPGSVFGRFELIAQVGSGGFGTVWRAHDTVLKRTVALKIPRRDQLGPDHITDFLREARAAARIRHRGVVQVFDAGEEAGMAFITSEFIDGRSLQQALGETSFSYRAAASLCRQIAEALNQAHELAIVHLDLKPSNVLLDSSGSPHVADFGLARIEAENQSDQPGWLAGTLPYMAPEQTRDTGEQPGPAADIYALGVLLSELLTGRRPFSGNRRELLEKIQHSPPPPLRQFDRRIPRDLEAICRKCLAKKPSQRYGSAADLAEDLRRFLDNEPVASRPGTVVGRTWRWCQRKPATAILSGTLAIVLTGAVLALTTAVWKSRESLEIAEEHLYYHHISTARQKWLINDPEGAWRLLKACPPGRREIEWSLLNHLFGTPARKLVGAGRNFDFCADGTQLISSGGALPLVRHWALPSGDVRDLTQNPNDQQDWVSWIDVSPDGQFFLTADAKDNALRLRDVETGEVVRVLGRYRREVLQAYFVDQGARIVAAVRDNTVRKIETESGDEVQMLPFQSRIRAIAVSPEDPSVAVSTGYAGECAVTIWSHETGEQLANIPTNCQQVGGLAFSPDGSLLALAESLGVMQIWRAAPIERVMTITGPLTNYACPAFHPSGQWIAAESWDGAIRVWSTTTGKEVRVLRGHQPPTGLLRFTPDGNGLAAGSDDDSIHIWNIRVEQGAVALGKCLTVTDLALAPEGDLLAVACGDGSVSMWEMSTRRCRWKVSISDARVFSVAFSPDATRLVCACEDTTAQILDARTGRQELRFAQHERPLRDAAFSPNGDRVVSAGIGDTALIWDAETGEVMQALWLNTIAIRCLAFHPDGSKVAAGTRDAVVVVWDVKSGDELWRDNIPFLRVWNLAWSPSGDILAVTRSDGNVRIHAAEEGTLLAKFGIPAKDNEVELTFSSDGSRLLTGSAQKLVALWELPSGREVLRLTENTATGAPVAIDPNNRFVVTTQLNGTVLLWPATGATSD